MKNSKVLNKTLPMKNWLKLCSWMLKKKFNGGMRQPNEQLIIQNLTLVAVKSANLKSLVISLVLVEAKKFLLPVNNSSNNNNNKKRSLNCKLIK